jgi:hypothetical protein
MATSRRILCAAALALMALPVAAAGCGMGDDEEPAREASRAASSQFFSPRSFWNRPLAPDTPVARNSTALVAELRGLLAGTNPWIDTWQFTTPVYRVGRRQRRARVKLDTSYPPLARAFRSVPLPRGARPAPGQDGHLVVWQRSTDTMWEFFKLRRARDGWHARWGGRMKRVSRSRGVFPAPLGATATGLPLVGGLIREFELRRGRIDHALAVSLPHTRAKAFNPPATRTDGDRYSPTAIPEGARFRLDPRLDISRLRLPRVTRIIAKAVQRYGMIVRDKGGAVTFYAEASKPGRRNRYKRLFGGRYPSELLRAFPWHRLQLVRARLIHGWKAPES